MAGAYQRERLADQLPMLHALLSVDLRTPTSVTKLPATNSKYSS